MSKNFKNNPISLAWKKRYEEQPINVQKALDDLKQKREMTDELISIKCSKKTINIDDIFLVQPKEGIYFYGRVLNARIQYLEKDHWHYDAYVVFIFNIRLKELTLDNFKIDYQNLLIRPAIVTKQCWILGYFYNIGNVPLTEYEHKLDYGFYSVAKGKYFKENGEEILHQPQILGTYAIGSYGSIAYEIAKEIIINPNLIK